LIGFLLLAALANSGLFSDRLIDAIGHASDALFLLAFSGLGFEIQFRKIRQSGITPLLIVGIYFLIISLLTYLSVAMIF
jgi:uncharacterized membrane protein YadS